MRLRDRLLVIFISLLSVPVILTLIGLFLIIFSDAEYISRHAVLTFFIGVIAMLFIIAFLVTRWVNLGVFSHISKLNEAMENIALGNFDMNLSPEETSGEIAELFGSYEDMRLRLKDAKEERITNEKRNSELISNITHDLKTPITTIKGYVEGIMDGVADTPEKKDKYIKTIYNKTNELDRLINELTYYQGIDTNRIPYHFQRLHVSRFFADCVAEEGQVLEEAGIRLNYDNFLSSEVRIIADPVQLKKVISNIIGNSVKYMDKPKGIIEIRLLDDVDSIRVEIEDNGKGIENKDLSRIFERFYRTDESRNSAKGGSGIGLSIVKKIVEDHGGYIWASSREGEGTCIHFVIRKYIEQGEE